MRNKSDLRFLAAVFFLYSSAALAANDSFQETFDSRPTGATLHGVDSWQVASGSTSLAIASDGPTLLGEGKSLELAGASSPVRLSRPDTYGNVSPAWIEWVIRPGQGAQSASVPPEGIAAFNFDPSGKILASDGASWVDTGQTFTTEQWVRILLKLDFIRHVYDIYISPGADSKIPFIADKENLRFIDPSINSLSEIGFSGAYHETQQDNTFVDQLTVHFVKGLSIASAPAELVKNRPSAPITVQLQNSNSELQTAWEDITLEFHSSSNDGEFSLELDPWVSVSKGVIVQGRQALTFYYKDPAEGKPTIQIHESPPRGWEAASWQPTVTAEGQFFDVQVSSPQVAGQAFGVRIIAKDDQGNVNAAYHGPASIITQFVQPSSGSRALTPAETGVFSGGILDLSLVYPDCGLIQILVQDNDEDEKKGMSGPVLFVPDRFALEAQTSQVVGRAFALTVSALGADGSVTPNYQGPVLLSSEEGYVSPAVLESALFQSGVATVQASFDRWGSVRIKAADQGMSLRFGLSEALNFAPAGIVLKAPEPPTGRDFFYTGESFQVTLSVVDAQGEPIVNFQGWAQMSATPHTTLPERVTFSEEDRGQRNLPLTIGSSGSFVISGRLGDYASLSGQTEPILVKQASIQVVSTVAPLGSAEVEIQLLDERGKRITSENKITVRIDWDEENPNGSVFSSSFDKPIEFHHGVAKIVIGNSEAETVTLTPKSDLGFDLQKGTITFGRIGKSGLGTLMMLESKDEEAPPKK